MKAFDYFSPNAIQEASELLLRYGTEAKLRIDAREKVTGEAEYCMDLTLLGILDEEI